MASNSLRRHLSDLPDTLLNRTSAFMLAAVWAILFADALNFSAIVIALPSIQQEFHIGLGDLQWVVTAYALTLGICLVAGSRAGSVYKHKTVVIVGLVFSAIFNLVSAVSPTFTGLAVSRAFQGIGAALVLPSAQAHIGSLLREPVGSSNSHWIDGTSASIGSLLGFAIGGAFTQHLTWRWIFWLSFILNLVLVPVVAVTLPSRSSTAEKWSAFERSRAPYTSSLKGQTLDFVSTFDLGGLLLSLSSAILFTYAISSAYDNGWASANVLCPLIIALAVFAGFVFYESQLERPMIPTDMLSNLTLDLQLLSATLVNATKQACIFFLSLQLQYNGSRPLNAAAELLPISVTGLVFVAMSRQFISILGTRILFSAGCISIIIGAVVFSFISRDGSFWSSAFVGEILWSVGFSASYLASGFTAVSLCPTSQQDTLVTFFNVIPQVGGTILGLSVTVAISLGIGGQYDSVSSQSTMPQIAFQAVYYTSAVLSFIALVFGALATIPSLASQKSSAQRSLLSGKLFNEKGIYGQIVHVTHDEERGLKDSKLEAAGEQKVSSTTPENSSGPVETGIQTGPSLAVSRATSIVRSEYSSTAAGKIVTPPLPALRTNVQDGGVVRYDSSNQSKQSRWASIRAPPTSRKNSFDQESERAINTASVVSAGPSPLDSQYVDESPSSFGGPTPFESPNRPHAHGYFPGSIFTSASRSGTKKSTRSTRSEAVSVMTAKRPSLKRSTSRKNSFARSRAENALSPSSTVTATIRSTTRERPEALSPAASTPNTPGSRSIALNNSYALKLGSSDYALSNPSTPAKTPRTAQSLASQQSTKSQSQSRSKGRHIDSKGSWYTDRNTLPSALQRVAERDSNPAPQPVNEQARHQPLHRPSVDSVVGRICDQGWEQSARIANALSAAASTERPLPPLPVESPTSIYEADGNVESAGASRRTSWSSWHRTKTPKLEMNFSFEQIPAVPDLPKGIQ